MQIKITPNETSNPPGKVADAELHFTEGPLAGLKLIGFSIWERRYGQGYNVTFPARSYSVNGERRSFALLRPAGIDASAQDTIRELILAAYRAHQDGAPAEHIATPAGPVSDHTFGTAADYGSRSEPPTPTPAAPTPTAAPFDF